MDDYLMCTPGPVGLAPSIYCAMQKPIIPHYGSEWIEEVYNPVCNMAKDVFITRNKVYIIPASGTGGVESAFCSLGHDKAEALIFSNGYFGKRMCKIARKYFKCVYEVETGDAITNEHIEKAIKQYPTASVVGIVHGETSTGVKNEIESIRNIVKDRIVIVDAISTLGGDEIKVDKWGIDICISATQKAIGAAPGLALVSVSDHAFQKMPQRKEVPGYYFNLLEWRDAVCEWGESHPYPVTLPVNLFYALYAAFEDINKEGLEQRIARHNEVSRYTKKRVLDMGLELLSDNKELTMSIVTAVKMPKGIKASDLLSFLKINNKILIANGQGELKDKIFRIGHLAESANTHVVDMVLKGIEAFFLH